MGLAGAACLVALLFGSGSRIPAATEPAHRELSFEQRVKAQEAIERVYYFHQLETTEPFEKAVPRSVLEAKVARYLKQSAALEQVWKTPVSAEMLRREWERIAGETRLPERLLEIYAALDRDPVLIQECFVRPALVDRLVRNFYQGDRFLQAGPRGRAEHLVEALQHAHAADESIPQGVIELRVSESPAPIPGPAGQERRTDREEVIAGEDGVTVRDVTPAELEEWQLRHSKRAGEASVEETSGSFIVRILLDSGSKSLRFRQYEIEKEPFDRWWSKNNDRFDASTVPVVAQPVEAPGHTPGIGTENFAPGPDSVPCLGSDTWDNGPLSGPPQPRTGHSAVWTGTLMLIWGGVTPLGTTQTGERYDPLTDTWSLINLSGAPANRSLHTATWTGAEMVVWGGKTGSGTALNSGGRYDPVTDTWTACPPRPRSVQGTPTRRYGPAPRSSFLEDGTPARGLLLRGAATILPPTPGRRFRLRAGPPSRTTPRSGREPRC